MKMELKLFRVFSSGLKYSEMDVGSFNDDPTLKLIEKKLHKSLETILQILLKIW